MWLVSALTFLAPLLVAWPFGAALYSRFPDRRSLPDTHLLVASPTASFPWLPFLPVAAIRRCVYTPDMQDFTDHIAIEPGIRSGKPCIRGTRITVSDVLEYLASGMTEQEVLQEFPELKSEDIRAVLQYAATRERRLASSHS